MTSLVSHIAMHNLVKQGQPDKVFFGELPKMPCQLPRYLEILLIPNDHTHISMYSFVKSWD